MSARTRPADLVCATCKRVLDVRIGVDGAEYLHADTANQDHDAVPVHPSQVDAVDLRCDVCSTTEPGWRLPVDDFTYPVIGDHGSRGDWLLCGACAEIASRGQWPALLRRGITAWEAGNGPMLPEVQTAMGHLYRQLRRNATGLPVRRDVA